MTNLRILSQFFPRVSYTKPCDHSSQLQLCHYLVLMLIAQVTREVFSRVSFKNSFTRNTANHMTLRLGHLTILSGIEAIMLSDTSSWTSPFIRSPMSFGNSVRSLVAASITCRRYKYGNSVGNRSMWLLLTLSNNNEARTSRWSTGKLTMLLDSRLNVTRRDSWPGLSGRNLILLNDRSIVCKNRRVVNSTGNSSIWLWEPSRCSSFVKAPNLSDR